MAHGSAFDIAVVGGGAAGCVVAARLARSTTASVVLLEAGPDLRANPPAQVTDGWRMTREFDWGYVSEPDARGNVEDLRRVRLLGGSSSITRFALRGSPADFDGWAALGNPGWGWADVLPFLRDVETDLDFGGRPWHGDHGPIPISRYLDVEASEPLAALLRAAESVGFPAVDDHNEPGAVGVGMMPRNSRDGVRVTTADAFLPADSSPPNLVVRADSQVADVVLTGTRTTGVRLLDGTVVGASTVVLCAGTYGSPPILLRSGVGPAEHLRSLRIAVNVDLPGVGANLSDHPGLDIDCGFRGTATAARPLHAVATFRSGTAAGDGAPDVMLWLSDPVDTGDGRPILEIDVVLLTPVARGRVRLRSADPSDPPRIELPRVTDRRDVERLAEGYRRGWEVAGHPEVRRICREAPSPELGGPDIGQAISELAYSLPHVVGTCAMGPSPEAGGVVDASGRVHGTDGLFVVDASIIPTAPSGFTHIPTIMIAERLSRDIARTS